MQNNIVHASLKESVPTQAAGRLLISRSLSIIQNAKIKQLQPDNSFSLPCYEVFRLHGMLLRMPKHETKQLIQILAELSLIRFDAQRQNIFFEVSI